MEKTVQNVSTTGTMPKKTLLAVCCALLYSQPGLTADVVEYDSSFLMGDGAASIDVSRYSDGNPTPVGTYTVKVFVNEKPVASQTIPFIDVSKKSAEACLTPKNLAQLHIKQPEIVGEKAVLKRGDEESDDCLNLPALIDQSSVEFDMGDQRLDITVPQAWVNKGYEGYVEPSLWESGIPAALLSYNINGYHNTNNGVDNDSMYAAFNTGVNLGAWRFRANGNYNWDKDNGSNFDFQNRYVQRDLPALRSQLIMGESYTTGETFDSVSIRGVRLYSDSRMLPSQLANYAPVIRGVANTNAKVTVTQSGYKIYEATVPPGPFEINDLSPSGYGSDLIVTIEEADGSKRTFSQPFSSVMQMQKPGVGRWDFSAGEVNDDDIHDKPYLAQGTYYYGLNNYLTAYSGIQGTNNHYLAGLIGVGLNTPFGALALDVTHSRTEIPDDKTYQGQSYRLTWNKLIEPTNTSFNVAAYRYSTQDYLGLNDALQLIDDAKYNDDDQRDTMDNYARMKNQITLSISQPLQDGETDYGSFYLSGSWTDYWATGDSRSDYTLGYGKGFSWGSMSINLQRTWDEDGEKDDSLYINLSIPLANLLGGEDRRSGFTSLSTQMRTDFNGGHNLSMNSSGNNEDNTLNYSVNTGYTMQKEDKNISDVGGYVSYQSPWGDISASASANNDSNRQYSLSTDGGFILHSGGLTFTNDNFSNSDALVLVKAPGAKGARINGGGSTIDRWGYGASNALSAYRENQVSLDIDTLENDVELKSTSTMLVPRDGAVVFASFETDQGRSAIITMTRNDGKTIPFGAEVFEGNTPIGNMGQGGQAFVRGINDRGELTVRWFENNQPARCSATYQLPTDQQTVGSGQTLLLNNITCRVINHNQNGTHNEKE
ncbi:outer membrane usher protein [Salmonella enterica]|uniref:Outer membrane usher protein n=2 Tax=Salmonella enterica subsp. salamae TaxID=59202 RepID=A0A701QRE2_SALER|nr:outer membrane usher protein [Salmonella enterica]ECE5986123.1 outer membrane usher protein [Salmonella enterica subsp. salamae]EKR2156787.1 outer membrane usher protein [Salmonella enterica subsp. salamae serovar 40:c:z6]HAC6411382.1 outer membrane usher protein [Salmonella enterica subsp. salamae serovar 58:a:-]HAE8253533.1 outer membrane usher protein [Salmonella enterica subsp. salamae serovar 42:b:1,5]HCM1867883.1 outer membrane usher protein [Salmonella enterica subsp. salamae serovar